MHTESKKFKSTIPGRPGSIAVNGDIANALRIFKRQTKQSGILLECSERRWYIPPSKSKRAQSDRAKHIQSLKAQE